MHAGEKHGGGFFTGPAGMALGAAALAILGGLITVGNLGRINTKVLLVAADTKFLDPTFSAHRTHLCARRLTCETCVCA